MVHLIHHLYNVLWPNIFAPSFWTLAGIAFAHFRSMRHIKKHNDLLDTSTPGGLTEVINEIRNSNGGTKTEEA